jgi:hypothetical protein
MSLNIVNPQATSGVEIGFSIPGTFFPTFSFSISELAPLTDPEIESLHDFLKTLVETKTSEIASTNQVYRQTQEIVTF